MGGLFNLAKALVSALHIELKYKVEKLKYKKLEVTKPRIKKFRTSSWWINHPWSSVHIEFYIRDELIQSIKWGEGGGAYYREGAYLSCWGLTRGFNVSQIRGNLSKFHGERRYVTNLRMLVSESSTKKDCRSFSVQWAVLGRFCEEISSH